MSRLSRLHVPGLPQLLLQRGNNGIGIFSDEADYACYRDFLRNAAREVGLPVHAYVLMPNHVHLLVAAGEEGAAGSLMQRLGRRYVRYFNDRHGRTGTLWEGRYRSTVIEPKQYVLACYRYIELNPVRSGLVTAAEHYPWSSCRHHFGLTSEPLVTDHERYWALGNTPFERQATYRAMLEAGEPNDELTAIRYAAHRGWMLGESDLVSEASANRRTAPLPKGRPRRSVIS
ncbi:transposase [Uliginosibacterium sp. H3]|uniref:Transposase n=1 Tax=Uliginosibacterium silvisoli TaxID=3114758 RepID=A0ABU6JZ56_9RHOO|nr:transposase [Uliginosibacterium sp. H3]